MIRIRRYLLNILIAFDQLLSAIAFGDPDETISSRLGKAQRGDHGPFWFAFWLPLRLITDCLFFPFDGWGHCRQSIEEDEGEEAILGI